MRSPPARSARGVALVAALFFACAAPLSAQSVKGLVVDSSSHEPVKGADVVLLVAKGQVAEVVSRELTDSTGRFALRVPKLGAYAVEVEALGYTTYESHFFTLGTSQEASLQVSLEAAPVALKGLSVTATALHRELEKVGFYRREELGFGSFLTAKQIERRVVDQVTDVFYGMPGVRVVCDPFDPTACDLTIPALSDKYWTPAGIQTCYPSIYVDRVLTAQGGNHLGVRHWEQLMSPYDIAGIEVYPNPSGLPAFASGSDSPCGTVVIWTKTH